jgi:hypothetical protein
MNCSFECKKRHPNPHQIGELSAVISQQASPPQAKNEEKILWTVAGAGGEKYEV